MAKFKYDFNKDDLECVHKAIRELWRPWMGVSTSHFRSYDLLILLLDI